MRLRYYAAVLTLLVVTPPRAAAQAHLDGATYRLQSGSLRQWGCHDPCACPESAIPALGSFRLVPAASDPLFSHYDLLGIDWRLDAYGTILRWTGTGHYRVGGEVAILHQLVLDLENDGRMHHYDSGLISGGGSFPRIQIAAAAETVGCFHDIFDIDAAPATANVPELGVLRVELRPNPFQQRLEIAFALDAPAVVRAEVFDIAGRRARTLVDAERLGTGPQSVAWDGHRDDGSLATPGIYRVRLRVGARDTWRTLARID